MTSDLAVTASLAQLHVLIARGVSAMDVGDLGTAEEALLAALIGGSKLSYGPGLTPELRTQVEKARHDNRHLLGAIEGQIGSLMRTRRQPLKAVKFALRAAKRHRLNGEFERRALLFENAANAYMDMQRPDRAGPLYADCLETLEGLGRADKVREVRFMVQQIRDTPPLVRMTALRQAQAASCVAVELLLQEGKGRQALSESERILSRWPDCGGGWDMRGQCLASLGQNEDALACHRKSVEYDPTDPVAFRNFAFQLDAMGRYSEAYEQQCHACDLAPEDGQILSGLSLYMLKCCEARTMDDATRTLVHHALLFLDEAIEFSPDWSRAYLFKANALLALGLLDAADAVLLEGLSHGADAHQVDVLAQAISRERRH